MESGEDGASFEITIPKVIIIDYQRVLMDERNNMIKKGTLDIKIGGGPNR